MSLSRRRFLTAVGYGAAAAAIPGMTRRSSAGNSGIPIGLQLYTLKAELEKDFEGTLQKVASIGIREVELIAFPDRKPAELLRALRNAGLQPVSMHAKPGSLVSGAQGQIDAASELGVQYLITPIPVLPNESPSNSISSLTLDDWRWNADLCNRLGEQAQKSAIQFGYHNHSMEFKRFDGVAAYDELLKGTDPALVTMELDCGWAENAGADVAEYLRHYAGRFRLLHVKDIKRRSSPDAGFKLAGTAIGRGIIDWAAVFSAGKKGGVRHYFIEQEPPFERPALESVRMSYDWLSARKFGR